MSRPSCGWSGLRRAGPRRTRRSLLVLPPRAWIAYNAAVAAASPRMHSPDIILAHKFALLGTDADSLDIARAAVESGHILTAVCEPQAERLDELARPLAPMLTIVEHWESLLDEGQADVVIISHGNDDARWINYHAGAGRHADDHRPSGSRIDARLL